jgi:hypothetical protein
MKKNVAEALVVEYHRLKREPIDCLEASIIDMITDLMHLARREHLDALALIQMAQIHFEAEEESVF